MPPNSRPKFPSKNSPLESLERAKQKYGTRSPDRITKPDHASIAFQIIAGSYEKILYGILVSFPNQADGAPTLKPVFTFPAHASCIKAVASSPRGAKWLATGSADEVVKVWDLRRRKEVGGLLQHQGSITFLHFPSRSHLLTASDDGTICLFHARDWSLLRCLKGHKGRVNCVAIHPSGKVALSVGSDRTLRMWDMMRGKGSGSTKLGKEGEIVRWSTTGDVLAVQSGSTVDVYTTDMTLLHSITHPSRVHDIKFCKPLNSSSEVLLVCAEDKKVTIYDIQADNYPIIAYLTGHQNRVKSIDILSLITGSTYAATVSSDGKINVYHLTLDFSSTESKSIEPVGSYDTNGTRLTCVTIAEGDLPVSYPVLGKRKRTDENVEGAEVPSSDVSDGSAAEEEESDQ